MRQLFLASVASLALAIGAPAFAQTGSAGAVAGGNGGAAAEQTQAGTSTTGAGQTTSAEANGAKAGRSAMGENASARSGNPNQGYGQVGGIGPYTPANGISGALDKMYLERQAGQTRGAEGSGATPQAEGRSGAVGTNRAHDQAVRAA